MPTDQTLDITAIVISYNSEGRIGEAVKAHERVMQGLNAEVIVVDNASSDASVDEARAAINNGTVIANEDNVGYGKAANQAISIARGRACLIMNDDARLEPGAAERMLDVLFSSEDIALVGPRIVSEEGEPMPGARATFPGLGEEWQRFKAILSGRNENNLYPADIDPTDVAWLVGACILGRTDVLRSSGGFNPVFFLYAEDIDLAKRFDDLGYRIVTVPDAVCTHTGSVSTGQTFGRRNSIDRRTHARDIYYRIWLGRPSRSLIHLRRAVGFTNQPARLKHHLPKVLWDGPSLHSRQRIDPIPAKWTPPST